MTYDMIHSSKRTKGYRAMKHSAYDGGKLDKNPATPVRRSVDVCIIAPLYAKIDLPTTRVQLFSKVDCAIYASVTNDAVGTECHISIRRSRGGELDASPPLF